MSQVTCTRRIQFCAGHRVVGHEGKCQNVHGHNYVAWITAEASDLDGIGRVIDFSVLKEKVGGWIEKNWDHQFIAAVYDKEVREALSAWPVFTLPTNPTAENMAAFLLQQVCPKALLGTGVRVTKVVLDETENCSAEVSL